MLESTDSGVKNRLIKFLLKDKMGIRRCLLKLFLQDKSCTTGEAYDYLIKQGFNVNYRGVSALVGQIHSRLGILRVYLTNRKHNVYFLDEDHWDTVMMVLNSYSAAYQAGV
jgi:hypothetical protein